MRLRVGLVGLGLAAYWLQFDGLEERLAGYLDEVADRLAAAQRTIVNLGLVDSIDSGHAAAHRCRTEDIDILLVYATTYALSATLLPVLRRAAVPVILLNLQPEAAIDYGKFNAMTDRTAMTGEWLAYCGACPVPEIANVMTRLGMPFEQITGTLHGDPECWAELEGWMEAASVVNSLAHSRLGLMGHDYGGMLDIATDLVQVSGRFGVAIEMVEVDELSALRRTVSDASVASARVAFDAAFELDADCGDADLLQAARTAAALDSLVAQRKLDALAYFYRGEGTDNAETMSSIILGTSLLTARHIPVAGEYEVKNALAMKVLDLLGAGGSFTEYYAVDFARDLVLMGHDGPGHPGVSEGRLRVRPLRVYHGKVGSGLSVEMSVRHGAVTLLSVVEEREHGFKLLVAEGESVAGENLQIGNTNSFYRFPLGARRFIEGWNAQSPAHHCAVGTGHLAAKLSKVAKLLKMPLIQIC